MTAAALAHPAPRPVTARREALQGWCLALPATLLLVLIVLAPLAAVLGLSLTDYSLGQSDTRFIGGANYARLWSDPAIRRALVNTATYVGLVVPAAVGIGLGLALLIQARRRLRHVYEVVFFLPVTSTFVAMAFVWQFLLHGRIGPINGWLQQLGLGRADFLTDPAVAIYALAALGAWQLIGFNVILFLAGLASLPRDVHDAASLDGMRGAERFARVTWPLLAPTALFVTVTSCITACQVFDSVAALTRGGPMGSTDVLLYRIYQTAYQQLDIGLGAALSVVFLTIIVAISLLQVAIADRRIHYS